MEFAKNLWIVPSGHGEPGADGVLEWGGLHARLSAAHALRRELVGAGSGSAPLCGSFSDWPVSSCDGLRGKRLVNLKNSTDRKEPSANKADSAGWIHAGGREQ